jgi:hypothetical protein
MAGHAAGGRSIGCGDRLGGAWPDEKRAAGARIGLGILAVIGGIALIAVLAMSFMHFGMMGGMMSCCG